MYSTKVRASRRVSVSVPVTSLFFLQRSFILALTSFILFSSIEISSLSLSLVTVFLGKRLAITTEFDFNDQLLTECKAHVNTITSTRNNGSTHFGWSMGIVALAAVAMAALARKKRQLATAAAALEQGLVNMDASSSVDKTAFVEMAHQQADNSRNALV
jgi:hypothetical protein